jgi:hypothetical protein
MIGNVMAGGVACMTYMRTVVENKGVNEIRTSWTVLLNIVLVIKSKRIRWAGHVAGLRKGEACIEFWWRNIKERDQWGETGVDGR